MFLSIGTVKSYVMSDYVIQLLILEVFHFFFSSCALYVKSRGVDQLLSSSSTFCTGSLCGRNAVRTGTDCVAHLLLRNPDLGFVLVCCASPLANRI